MGFIHLLFSWQRFVSASNRLSKIFSIKTSFDRKWLLDTMETFVEKTNGNKTCSADGGDLLRTQSCFPP